MFLERSIQQKHTMCLRRLPQLLGQSCVLCGVLSAFCPVVAFVQVTLSWWVAVVVWVFEPLICEVCWLPVLRRLLEAFGQLFRAVIQLGGS